jgi:hypothetical protein
MENIIYHRHNIALYNVLNQEVVFEEYFCNLLQFDDFRDLFIDFINEQSFIKFDKNKIKYYDFNTEVKIEDDGRADLFLNYENQGYIFEIKNKDKTKLTDNQPKGYLKYLGNKNLFFLIPRNYKHQIDIIDRWKKYKDNTNIENHIFYWEDFINLLENNKNIKERIEVKLFYDFCIDWFNMKPVIFTNNELLYFFKNMGDKQMYNIANIMKKLCSIVNGVIDLGIKIDKKYDKQDSEYFGYWIDNKKYGISQKLDVWFGINYDIWEKNTNASLILEMYSEDKDTIKELKQLDRVNKFIYADNSVSFYYTLTMQEEIDMKKQYFDFIKEKLNIIKTAKI